MFVTTNLPYYIIRNKEKKNYIIQNFYIKSRNKQVKKNFFLIKKRNIKNYTYM